MNPWLILIAALMGGLGRRVAGGGFTQWTGLSFGDVPVRVFFGLMGFAIAWMAGTVWWVSLLAGAGVFIGCSVPNFSALCMGYEDSPVDINWGDFRKDFLALTGHGIGNLALTVLVAWWFQHAWGFVVLGGALISPGYVLGYLVANHSRAIAQNLPVGFRQGAELGEIFWGMAAGVCLFLAFSL